MKKVSAIAVALSLSVCSVSRAGMMGIEYGFFPIGNPNPVGNIVIAPPPALSVGWTLPFTAALDPSIASFNFDFTSVGGPIVTLGQFNHLFPIPGQDIVSMTGQEIDGGVLIGDSGSDQGQWGMSNTADFDQARWINSGGSTPTILGNWRELPEPATLTLLVMGGLAMLRRRL